MGFGGSHIERIREGDCIGLGQFTERLQPELTCDGREGGRRILHSPPDCQHHQTISDASRAETCIAHRICFVISEQPHCHLTP